MDGYIFNWWVGSMQFPLSAHDKYFTAISTRDTTTVYRYLGTQIH